MSDAQANLRATLDALRADSGARVDAIHLARIEALQRRAAMQTGAVRELLDARLAELVATPRSEATRPTQGGDVGQRHRLQSPLKDVLRLLDRNGAKEDAHAVNATRDEAHASSAGIGTSIAVPGTRQAAFEDIRKACAEVRTRSQLRQALSAAPADAGPLNSASLVHRALSRMQALSPEYLRHFLVYVDAISALQPLCGTAAKPAESAPHGAAAGKRSRARSRSPKA